MFIGDSVTCGGGVDNNAQCKPDPEHPANNVYDSYGMLLGRRMDAQIQLVCYGGRGLERDYRGLGISDGVLNAPQFLDLAVVTDEPLDTSVRQFGLDDVQGIADLIETGFLKPNKERFTLLVNDKPIALNAFTKEFIVNIQLAMAHGLNGVDKIHTLKIFLKKDE